MRIAKSAGKKHASKKRRKQRKQDDNAKQIHDSHKMAAQSRNLRPPRLSWQYQLARGRTGYTWQCSGFGPESSNLTEAFDDARAHSVQLLGKAALTTYQGMAEALQTWTPEVHAAAANPLARTHGADRPTPSASRTVGGHRDGWIAS